MSSNTHDRSAWFILFVLLTASVAAPLNQFKAPPVMPYLMEAFELSVGTAGLLMSLFAATGLILALPAGFIFQKLGYRNTGLLAVGAVVIGASLGAVSPDVFTMLASRVIEGVGMSFMTVVAPAVIALRFPADQRGTPMGIWATWVPLGSTLMFVLAPPLVAAWNWQGVWWFGCLFAVAAWFLYYLFIRPAPDQRSAKADTETTEMLTKKDLVRVLRNRDLWLISLVFCCFNYAFVAFLTWAPTFLNALRAISLGRASLLVSVLTIFSIVSLPLSGWISDRLGSRKLVCVVPMILLALLYPVAFFLKEGGFFPLAIVIGLVCGFVPTGVFAAGVECTDDERLAGMTVAVILVGQNAGMLLGPITFGWFVQALGGWQTAFYTLIPVCILGAVAGWIAKVR